MLRTRPPALAACVLTVALGTSCAQSANQLPSRPAAAPADPSSYAGRTPERPSSAPSGRAKTAPRPASNPAGLNDQQMVGQLFVSYVYGSTATSATQAQRAANIALYGVPTGAEVITRWHLGGVILIDHNNLDPSRPQLSTGNVINGTQISALTAGLQAAAQADGNVPLLIGTDQEGGRVQRITSGVVRRPAQQQLASLSPAALRCSYFTLGRDLRTLGINQDYAPDADVVTTASGVIGDRSFGPNPVQDAADVVQAVAGLQHAGVLATLKHWPGHGSTTTDSHAALAVIDESAAQWQATDRRPFLAAVTTAAAVMVGHLALPSIDPSGQPATLSPSLVNGQLRHHLGYQGLTITDSLYMQPMQAAGPPGQVALRALAAGNDMLLETPDLPHAEQAILEAISSSRASRKVVTTALTRILTAKRKATATPSADC